MSRYLKQRDMMDQMGQRTRAFYGLAPFLGFACVAVFLFLPDNSHLVFAANEPVGMATNTLGDFSVFRAESIEEPMQGKGSLPLWEGDSVRTQGNSLAQLALLEGITVMMNENTTFRILSRWEKATGFTRILRLTQGELWIKMQRATIPIEVETPLATAAMSGPEPPSLQEEGLDPFGLMKYSPQELLAKRDTEFTVRVARDGQTTIQVVEGAVEFGTAFNTWILTPSTVSVAVRAKRCTKPQLSDVQSTMGWTKTLGQ
jgi:hypothetical protein